jgi:hypothetical protein
MRRKCTMGLLLGLLLASPLAHGQTTSTGDFMADPRSNCKVWDPHPSAGETVSWSGECINGLAQGDGTVLWSRYGSPFEKDEGHWDQGRQSGRGNQDWGAGRYEGELSEGEPSGDGVMMLKTSRYEGEFRQGKPNGEGTATTIHGVYKGKWKDGCLTRGKQTVAFAVSPVSCH